MRIARPAASSGIYRAMSGQFMAANPRNRVDLRFVLKAHTQSRRVNDRAFFLVRLPVRERVAGVQAGTKPGPSRAEVAGEAQRLQEALALKHENQFRKAYMVPVLYAGLIEWSRQHGGAR